MVGGMAESERQQIRAILRGVGEFTERLVTRITLDVTADLITHTPVDTGWSRANWVPRIGQPFEGTAGDRPARGTTVSGTVEQAAGQSAVLAYKLSKGLVHVTNNVPYIEALNDGHSPQEPAGFVQRAIARALQDVG